MNEIEIIDKGECKISFFLCVISHDQDKTAVIMDIEFNCFKIFNAFKMMKTCLGLKREKTKLGA